MLLGDPGSDKTTSFKQEAEESGGKYVSARNFVALEAGLENQGKTLFIDGLDEMRAGGGDSRMLLDDIRKHLARLGRPRFRLSCREADIDCTLANLQPANAADLAALTFDHLRDVARKIRNGSTNDYRQYWSYGTSNKKLEKSKPENDCRDALLSDLQESLKRLGIVAEREGSYADDKRADIKVSYGGANGLNIPVEIKKDSHDDLWHAIHKQLIAKYVRDPGTDGYGIYVVFWFGGNGMPPSPDSGKKSHSAQELEDCLRQTLSPEETHRIQVCVIDCALPQK